MKESYNKGIASHIGPESCLDDPRGRGEALTGESTGGLLSSENTTSREPILCIGGEGNMDDRARLQASICPGGVIEPGMCGRSLHENRETSGRKLHGREAAIAEATGKVDSHTPVVDSPEESDSGIVPEKPANKGSADSAELVEGRTLTERNSKDEAANRIQSWGCASNGLLRVRRKTGVEPRLRSKWFFQTGLPYRRQTLNVGAV